MHTRPSKSNRVTETDVDKFLKPFITEEDVPDAEPDPTLRSRLDSEEADERDSEDATSKSARPHDDDDAPKVYVGTYAKYNDGDLTGKWLNLRDYADHDEFMEAARELHKDEEDPELMFQDYSGFPKDYYEESSIKPELWDWINLDEDDAKILKSYREHMGEGTMEEARDAYAGNYSSKADWASSFLGETGALAEVPKNLRNYIDYEAYARDAELGGDIVFVENGMDDIDVFYNH